MLYPRWLETSRRHTLLPAVYDGDQVFTFGDLATAVEHAPPVTSPVIARAGGASFIVEILTAWRDGQAVIPVERDAPEPLLQRPPPADCRLVKYTPGAAGIPRGIFFNDAQVIADGDRIVAAMKLSPSIPNLAVISLSHSYGFSNVVLPLILHGVPMHLAPVPFPRAIEDIFKQHEAMVVPAVPSMWRAWHRAGILKNAPISLAISAGAPLAASLEADVFADAHLKIHNFYGASECGGISFDATDSPRESADDVGTVLEGVSVSANPDGRLLVSSSSVATGYDESRDGDCLKNGNYLTRDMGNLTEDGRLYLTGNCGGAINVAGRKVSPAKVEAALLATGCVTTVRVYGTPSNDPERCEEICAMVSLAQDKILDDLKAAAMERLQNWELPRHWLIGESLLVIREDFAPQFSQVNASVTGDFPNSKSI